MKLDFLAFGAHPDDVELSCSGLLLIEKANGKKTSKQLTSAEKKLNDTNNKLDEEKTNNNDLLEKVQ